MKAIPLALVAAATAIGNQSSAATIILEAISARSQNGGFWSSSYFTGADSSVEWRSNFVFNLSGISEQVVSAYLQLDGYNFYSSNPTETVTFFQSSVGALDAASPGSFGDLANGSQYGSLTVGSADANQLTTINLNSAAISAINAALDSTFSVGGAVTSLNSSPQGNYEGFFQGSSSSGIQRLVITTVPESSTAAILTAGLGFALLVRSRRAAAIV